MPPVDSAYDFNGIYAEVVRLRCLDHSQSYIARSLGIAVATVKKILDKEIANNKASREEMRQRTQMELNWLKKPLKEKYERDAQTPKGVNREDAVALLKIIERQCRLHALDEPARMEIKHTIEELSDDELNKQLVAHGVDVKQLPAHESNLESTQPVDLISDAEFTKVEVENTDTPANHNTSFPT